VGYFVRPKGNEDVVKRHTQDFSTFRNPVPPAYDRRRGVGTPAAPPPAKPTGWLILPFLVLVFLCAALIRGQKQNPSTVIATPVAIASPTPAPIVPKAEPPIAPKAEPVSGPLTTAGQPMLSGRQYFVSMPDGRHLLINWHGWVDHACNLPKQPLGGANNAAYTDSATGHTWIWTVPATGTNVPRWIDP
jgi:hypothetical protein